MKPRDFKILLYKEMAGMTKALGNPHRLEILDLLAQGPAPVEYIAKNTALTVANASQHLQVLKTAKLTQTDRRGKYIYYKLANKHVYETWCALRRLGFSQNEEISRLMHDYQNSREHLKTISSEELVKKMKEDKVLLVDVRPEEEYHNAHIKSALSLPRSELKKRMKELPKDSEIIAYCRGPLCVMADDAVELLNEYGYKAMRFEHGFPELKRDGFPVEQMDQNQNKIL